MERRKQVLEVSTVLHPKAEYKHITVVRRETVRSHPLLTEAHKQIAQNHLVHLGVKGSAFPLPEVNSVAQHDPRLLSFLNELDFLKERPGDVYTMSLGRENVTNALSSSKIKKRNGTSIM